MREPVPSNIESDSLEKKPAKLSKAQCLQQQVASIADISADLRKSVDLREKFSKLQEEVLLAQANNAKFQNLQKARDIGLITET